VHTIVVSILLPPTGELETSGDGSSPTDEQMSEELQARQDFIDVLSPHVEALLKRDPHRQENVSRIELLGAGIWSKLNHYLLLVSVDVGR